MSDDKSIRRRAIVSGLSLALLYFAGSLFWILGSDAMVAAVASNPDELNRLQNYKGVAFVTAMSVLLGYLVYRMTRARAEEERAYALTTTDPVTHLPNLVAFGNQLAGRIRAGGSFAVIFLDIEGFARINASLGRESGDRLLFVIGRRLRRVLDDAFVVARLQEDKFGIVTPAECEGAAPLQLAEGLVAALGNDIQLEGERMVRVRITAGIGHFPEDGKTIAQLMDAADVALDQTRLTGMPPVLRYDSAMQAARTENFMLESELREALRQRTLAVHFQPQFDLASGELHGAEALVRWFHREHGFISPARFIPVAEASGLIDQLSEFVLDAVCRQLRAWLDEGLNIVPVGVNIAGHQLSDIQLGVYLRDATERYRVPLKCLQVEITESLAVRDPERGIELLQSLRELGVTVALDDFGTGYSSLKYLLELPVDILKIDRSFISGLPNNAIQARFVKTIIDLGHDLNMHIIAEGVETEGQLLMLRELDCDYAQGYHLGRPVPAEEFRDWLLRRNIPRRITA